MIYYIIFFILCLFFCPKEWGQNFTKNNSLCPRKFDFEQAKNNSLCPRELDFLSAQNNSLCLEKFDFSLAQNNSLCLEKFDFLSAQNNSLCPRKLDFLSAQNNSLCPVNQTHIGCHSYPNENTKSEVCVKKAYKNPQIRSGFLVADASPQARRYRTKKSSGNSQIYSNPTPIDTGDFYIPDNNNIIRIRYYVYPYGCVEYSAYIDSGKDSFFNYLFNGFNVIRCMFYGRFYIDDTNEKLNIDTFLKESNYEKRYKIWGELPFYLL